MDPKNLTILLSIGIPAYLMIGFVIGIILKYRTARHLWTAHGMTVRPFRVLEIDCWCKWENMGGDLVFAAPYVSFLLWPIILAALIVSIPFTLHAKVFKVVTKLAQHDAPLKGIPGVGGRVQISAHDELQTLYNQLLEKCQGLQAMLAEQTKSLDGPTPVWVWPTVIVGGVAIVGIASYFMFFRKPKATVKV